MPTTRAPNLPTSRPARVPVAAAGSNLTPSNSTGTGLDWLDDTHEIFDAQAARWEQNERRARGGDYILDELRPFLWETMPGQPVPDGSTETPGAHYEARKEQAVYVNFPEMFTLIMRGHMHRNRPLPGAGLNFGTLGEVRRERDYRAPTRAELVYYNTDGVGNDGSQWDNYWLSVWARAATTGHRWMYVDSTGEPAGNQARERMGFRPYLVEFAPQQVTNWHFSNGRLAWAVVRIAVRDPVVINGTLEGNDPSQGYLLLVRSGIRTLGEEFAGGGWWKFDANKELIDSGDWSRTLGEIPMWPFFYDRDMGIVSSQEDSDSVPAMSRPGTTELGQAAISYMNLGSAADYDAWDAASSMVFLLGVDRDGFNIASAMWNQGSQIVPVPAPQGGNVPQAINGSAGAVTADVFDRALARKLKEAEKIAAQEAIGTPYASGESKKVGFGDVRAPRLANIASEIEQAQNIAIYFLELRWGNQQPSGSVSWPRNFDVTDVLTDIKEHFELENLTELKSKTLGAKLMTRAAREKGLITDGQVEATVEAEYQESAVLLEQVEKAQGKAVTPPTPPPATS